MADNKKYYYIRLKESFFDSNEIVLLESMQDGYLYSNILLKLYLRSLKDNGKLMFNDRIPYNSQMIATITRHQVGTVEKALKIFEDMGLIEILDNGAIYMLDIQNFIGKSTTEADRIRTYRQKIENEKIGIEGSPNDVQMYNKCTPEIEIDIEKDKDKKKKETYKSLVSRYTQNPLLVSSLNDYIEMRKKIKGFTVRALELGLAKLDKLASDDEEKIEIVNQTIENSWKGFFPLKEEYRTRKEITPDWIDKEEEPVIETSNDVKRRAIEMQYKLGSITEEEYNEKLVELDKSINDEFNALFKELQEGKL